MKPIDEVGITYVNVVLGRGVLNGVVNIQLGALTFDSTEDGEVSNEVVVVSRLRMDRLCAKTLRDTLDDLLASIEKAEAAVAASVVANGIDRQPEDKLN